MDMFIFLIACDGLAENIQELLHLEGLNAQTISHQEARQIFLKPQSGIVIFNQLTLDEPAADFIDFLKDRTDGIIALCSDADDSQLANADTVIVLPFDQTLLLRETSELMRRVSHCENSQ